MSEKKYVVPAGMLKAFRKAETHEGRVWDAEVLESMLTAAVRWLAENPISPDAGQCVLLLDSASMSVNPTTCEIVKSVSREWQRRMFLAPEPEIPEAVKDLLCDPVNAGRGLRFDDMADKVNDSILEAYRRGRSAR